MTERKSKIEKILSTHFQPKILTLTNESHFHQGSTNPESHFKLLIVSEVFINMSKLERHKKINSLIKDEFNKGLHAFTMQCFTPEEYDSSKIIPSPSCVGEDPEVND